MQQYGLDIPGAPPGISVEQTTQVVDSVEKIGGGSKEIAANFKEANKELAKMKEATSGLIRDQEKLRRTRELAERGGKGFGGFMGKAFNTAFSPFSVGMLGSATSLEDYSNLQSGSFAFQAAGKGFSALGNKMGAGYAGKGARAAGGFMDMNAQQMYAMPFEQMMASSSKAVRVIGTGFNSLKHVFNPIIGAAAITADAIDKITEKAAKARDELDLLGRVSSNVFGGGKGIETASTASMIANMRGGGARGGYQRMIAMRAQGYGLESSKALTSIAGGQARRGFGDFDENLEKIIAQTRPVVARMSEGRRSQYLRKIAARQGGLAATVAAAEGDTIGQAYEDFGLGARRFRRGIGQGLSGIGYAFGMSPTSLPIKERVRESLYGGIANVKEGFIGGITSPIRAGLRGAGYAAGAFGDLFESFGMMGVNAALRGEDSRSSAGQMASAIFGVNPMFAIPAKVTESAVGALAPRMSREDAAIIKVRQQRSKEANKLSETRGKMQEASKEVEKLKAIRDYKKAERDVKENKAKVSALSSQILDEKDPSRKAKLHAELDTAESKLKQAQQIVNTNKSLVPEEPGWGEWAGRKAAEAASAIIPGLNIFTPGIKAYGSYTDEIRKRKAEDFDEMSVDEAESAVASAEGMRERSEKEFQKQMDLAVSKVATDKERDKYFKESISDSASATQEAQQKIGALSNKRTKYLRTQQMMLEKAGGSVEGMTETQKQRFADFQTQIEALSAAIKGTAENAKAAATAISSVPFEELKERAEELFSGQGDLSIKRAMASGTLSKSDREMVQALRGDKSKPMTAAQFQAIQPFISNANQEFGLLASESQFDSRQKMSKTQGKVLVGQARRMGVSTKIGDTDFAASAIEGKDVLRDAVQELIAIRKSALKEEIQFTRQYTQVRMNLIKNHYDNVMTLERASLDASGRRAGPGIRLGGALAQTSSEALGVLQQNYNINEGLMSEKRAVKNMGRQRLSNTLGVMGAGVPQALQMAWSLSDQRESEQDMRRQLKHRRQMEARQYTEAGSNYRTLMDLGVSEEDLMSSAGGLEIMGQMAGAAAPFLTRMGRGEEVMGRQMEIVSRKRELAAKRFAGENLLRKRQMEGVQEQVDIARSAYDKEKERVEAEGGEVDTDIKVDLAKKLKEKGEILARQGKVAEAREAFTEQEGLIEGIPDEMKREFADKQTQMATAMTNTEDYVKKIHEWLKSRDKDAVKEVKQGQAAGTTGVSGPQPGQEDIDSKKQADANFAEPVKTFKGAVDDLVTKGITIKDPKGNSLGSFPASSRTDANTDMD